MKNRRHDTIVELITQYDIETQEELIEKLKQNGISVTQATVSRDIRDLKITKKPNDRGVYSYTMPNTSDTTKFNSVLVESIIKIDYAMNNIVIKTYPGLASAVASGIDGINMGEILGCVAGDDTIIIITRSERVSAYVSERILELIKRKE